MLQAQTASDLAFTEMSPTAFISAMASSGGTEDDCRSFATETKTDISTTVTSTQKMLDAVDNGSSCAAMGQDAVTTATAAVTAAKAELETAKTDKATKQSAKEAACSATFQVAALSLTSFKSGVLNKACLDISNMAGYTAADAACTSATTISTAADQAVVAATTKVSDADAALAADVAEASKLKSGCLCRVNMAQTAAWAAASTTIASHAADWKQSHEIVCALDKSTTCIVPACPIVTKPRVANGVASTHCTAAPTPTPTTLSPTTTPTHVGNTLVDSVIMGRGANACRAETFAGLGGCDRSISAQMVANFWCQRTGGTDAAPGGFRMVTGNHWTCYVAGAGSLSGGPKHTNYGCSGHCKCMQNIKCR